MSIAPPHIPLPVRIFVFQPSTTADTVDACEVGHGRFAFTRMDLNVWLAEAIWNHTVDGRAVQLVSIAVTVIESAAK